MIARRLRTLWLLLALACSSSTGVGNPGIAAQDQALIIDGTDALEAGDTSSAVQSLATLALTDPEEFVDSQTVASLVETRTPLHFEPAGCLTTDRIENEVTFTFDACQTGAFGLVALSGEMTAAYSVESASIRIVVATAPRLEVGRTSIMLESESLFTVTSSQRRVTWNGHYQATRPLRPDIDHESAYLAAYDNDSQCLSLDGSATTFFDDDVGVETSITDYLRCGPRGTCPQSGELALTRLPDRERSLTLEYDGSDRAWIPKLDTSVALDCRR